MLTVATLLADPALRLQVHAGRRNLGRPIEAAAVSVCIGGRAYVATAVPVRMVRATDAIAAIGTNASRPSSTVRS